MRKLDGIIPTILRSPTRVAKLAGAGVATLALTGSALAQGDNPLLPRDLSPWGMFMHADVVVKAVMVALALASFATWTAWLAKTLELRSARIAVRQRLKLLESGAGLAAVVEQCRNDRDAVAQLVLTTAREAELSENDFDESFRDRVALRLERVETAKAQRLSRGIGILATIGATAPFVGLFGTVWGIMNAFIGISQSHTTNLAVVAPGISEALLATALGLVAAIPAVVIYNHLVRVIAGYKRLLGDASAQLMLMISRESRARSKSRMRAAE